MKKYVSQLSALIFLISFTTPMTGIEGEESLLKALDEVKSDTEKILYIQKLAPLGTEKSEKKLADILKNSESSKVRSSAASALGEIKLGTSGMARAALELAFKTDDKYVREKAMESLSKISDKRSIPVFLEGYGEISNPAVRYWSLIGLARNGGKEHLKIFRESLKIQWEKTGANEAAIDAIGKYGINQDWDIILPFCSGKEPSLVISSLRAAGNLKNNDSLKVIESQLANENRLIAQAAMEALGLFSGREALHILIRFKAGNPENLLMNDVKSILKKINAEKQYAILNETLILRSEPTERSYKKKMINKGSIVVIIKKEPRRYIITDKSGEMEDYWYQAKDIDNQTGYLYGGYLTIVNSYD